MSGLLSLLLTLIAAFLNAGGAGPALTVSPATQSVDPGQTFTITIAQNADVATSGAQVNIAFDKDLLQIMTVAPGAAYEGGSFVLGVAPQTHEEAIAAANESGLLQNAGAFFFPGHAPVPAGPADFLVLTVKAKDGVNGASLITMANAEMLDSLGEEVDVQLGNGEVIVGEPQEPTATPTATDTPTQTPTPTPTNTPEPGVTPSPTPTPLPATPTSTMAPPSATPTTQPTAMPTATIPVAQPTATLEPEAALMLAPGTLTVPPGSRFQVAVKQQANVATSGAQANITFDPDLLKVVAVDKGAPYAQASLLYGEVLSNGEEVTGEAAIESANSSGVLKNVAAFFIPGTGTVPAGENDFVLVTLEARSTDGRSDVSLTDVSMLDANGGEIGATGTGGEVVIQTGAVAPPTPVPSTNSGGFTSFELPDSLPAAGAGSAPATRLDWEYGVLTVLVALALVSTLTVAVRRVWR